MQAETPSDFGKKGINIGFQTRNSDRTLSKNSRRLDSETQTQFTARNQGILERKGLHDVWRESSFMEEKPINGY